MAAGETVGVPHPEVVARLARLTPRPACGGDRGARPGPVCGAGRLGQDDDPRRADRLARRRGRRSRTVAAITFNKRAAEELGERLDAALAPLGVEAGAVRVRTFHALGREILRDAGVDVRGLVDRATVLAEVVPGLPTAEAGRYDTPSRD